MILFDNFVVEKSDILWLRCYERCSYYLLIMVGYILLYLILNNFQLYLPFYNSIE